MVNCFTDAQRLLLKQVRGWSVRASGNTSCVRF